MTTLLPCPFCGGMNVSAEFNDFNDRVVCCDDCNASGPIVELGPLKCYDGTLFESANSKAIELWNKRAPTLFGMPIIEVDMPDILDIVLGPSLI